MSDESEAENRRRARNGGRPNIYSVQLPAAYLARDSQGRPIGFKDATRSEMRQTLNRDQVGAEVKTVEEQQGLIKDKRQMVQTYFQGCDQRLNQLMNIIASVLKTKGSMGEMGLSGRGV